MIRTSSRCVLHSASSESRLTVVSSQIAIRDYAFPSKKETALTPLLHDRVCAKLQSLWGPHAGWAQQILFFADLKNPGSASPSPSPKKRNSTVPVATTIVVRDKFAEDLAQIMSTPGAKRRRVAVKIELKEESESEGEAYPSPASIVGGKKGRSVKREA